MDDRVRGTSPLWDCRDVAPESGVVYLVDQNTEESGSLFVWVGLELGVDFDDERGSHDGEQTGLPPELACVCVGEAKD